MRAIYLTIIVAFILCASGCSVVMPTISAGVPTGTRISDITAATTVALQNHDFSIATVNDEIGVVTTNWKDVKPTGTKILDALGSGGEAWRMMVTVTIDRQTQKIKIKPIKQISSSLSTSWDNAKLSGGEQKMFDEIAKEILVAIDAPTETQIVWNPPKKGNNTKKKKSPNALRRGADAKAKEEPPESTFPSYGFQIYQKEVMQTKKEEPPEPTHEMHEYHLTIVDFDGEPLQGAKIEYSTTHKDELIGQKVHTTNTSGALVETIQATSVDKDDPYRTKFTYKITKNGYYPQNNFMEITGIPSHDYSRTKMQQVTLLSPIDHLETQFASSVEGQSSRNQILTFIEDAKQKELLGDFELRMRAIKLASFKDKKYLQMTLKSKTSYDLQKLSKYDIGKKLFDDTLRKLLTPLNQHLSDSKEFYGYDLKVIVYAQRPRDKGVIGRDTSSQPIEYRFMMPQDFVRRYKNKDISGQRLLNESVVLMNDERIELKLQ